MSLTIVLSHVYCWPEVRRGGERYLHELSSALADAGHGVSIVSSAPQAGRGHELGVSVRRLRRRRLGARWYAGHADEVAFGVQALAVVARRRFDVWHALGPPDAAAAALLGRARGCCSTFTNLGLPWRSYWAERSDHRLHQYVVDHVDRYVCLSAAAARALEVSYGRAASVVGGGVDTRRFRPADRRAARPTLLYSGSLNEPRKNLGLLLEAAARLRRRGMPVDLWLSGPGDPSAILGAADADARAGTSVLGLGRPHDQGERYGRAWVTVLPATDEAFGLTLVESWACGTPVVARADSGGPAELVASGIGCLAGPSVSELADACAKAIDLAAQASTAAACRDAAMAYDWRRSIVPRLERVYTGEGPVTAGCMAP